MDIFTFFNSLFYHLCYFLKKSIIILLNASGCWYINPCPAVPMRMNQDPEIFSAKVNESGAASSSAPTMTKVG